METKLIWDDSKNRSNLAKHGLDFADADLVLESRYRLDIAVIRNGEKRTQTFAYVFGRLAVLSVVHTKRMEATHVISFRYASHLETEMYYDWLENDYEDPQ